MGYELAFVRTKDSANPLTLVVEYILDVHALRIRSLIDPLLHLRFVKNRLMPYFFHHIVKMEPMHYVQ